MKTSSFTTFKPILHQWQTFDPCFTSDLSLTLRFYYGHTIVVMPLSGCDPTPGLSVLPSGYPPTPSYHCALWCALLLNISILSMVRSSVKCGSGDWGDGNDLYSRPISLCKKIVVTDIMPFYAAQLG